MKKLAQDHGRMTSWASALEHVTSGFAMEKSTKICEKQLCKNARIPALGYGAVEDEDECLKPHSLAQVSEHFCTIFSRKFLLISPLQSRMSRAPMQRPMTSSSHDPVQAFSSMLINNADHAAWMGALR